jgi:uncharacterized protein (TIGR02145 family)
MPLLMYKLSQRLPMHRCAGWPWQVFALVFFGLLQHDLLAQTTYQKNLPCSETRPLREAETSLLPDSTISLDWNGLPDAVQYHVQLHAVDPIGALPTGSLLLDTFLSTPGMVLDQLPDGVRMDWQVQAQCGNSVLSPYTARDTFAVPANAFSCGDIYVDIRDGELYRTVAIGSQCWFQQNLNYLPPGTLDGVETGQGCNAPSKAGRFYNWIVAKQIDSTHTTTYYFPEGEQGVCPVGWHVPTDSDYMQLLAHPGIDFNSLLIGGGSGFELHLGGYMNTGDRFVQIEKAAFLITSSQADGMPTRMDVVAVDGVFTFLAEMGSITKRCRGTVRCIRDSP